MYTHTAMSAAICLQLNIHTRTSAQATAFKYLHARTHARIGGAAAQSAAPHRRPTKRVCRGARASA